MCKNNKEHKHCHHHKCNLDKTIENAIVENGAKEHLKEYEQKNKNKFDYKKYCKKNLDCSKNNKSKTVDFSDLKFVSSGYGMQIADICLENGFDFRVILGKDLLVEDIEIGYNYRETGKRLSIFRLFPELTKYKENLLRTTDVMIISEALRLAQKLPGEKQEQVLDKAYCGK